jgi:hypothetical protein
MTKLKFNPLAGEFDYVSTADDFVNDFFPSSLGNTLLDWFDASASKLSESSLESILDNFYPSTLGKGVSSQLETHITNMSIHSSSQAWSGAVEFYAVSSTAFKSGVAEVNMLIDVDTQSTVPTRNQVLKWNGSTWVPAAYDATFEFTISSFSDGQTTTQLIGSGVFKAQSAMTYTVAYNNGPPIAATVQLSNNGGAYSKVGILTTPFTTGTNTEAAVNYPTTRDQYLRFRASANTSSDYAISSETAIYFRNNIKYGVTTETSGWDSTDITGLTGTSLSSTYTGNFSVDASVAGNYILFAHPSTYSSLHASGMIFNSVMCPFEDIATVSVTNSAGYVENYKVYRSTLPALGNSTLTVSTSDTRINRIYYGGTSVTSSFTEANVEGLDQSSVTNDQTQIWTSITLDAGEYFLFAIPSRLSTPTFWDNSTGFGASFESPETVAVTNVNGQTENYKVFRSTNILGPGAFILETR